MKPKQFDPEQILEKIADVFARNGYEGTSLDTLIKETGIGKQSLYNAFGDKKAMVTKSLQCFGKKSAAALFLCNDELTGRERIEGFFNQSIKDATCTEYTGCLVTNLLLEKGNTDDEVRKAAATRWQMTKEGFKKAIEVGQKDKTIKADVDSELMAIMLMNVLNGMRVSVQACSDMKKLKKVINLSLELML